MIRYGHLRRRFLGILRILVEVQQVGLNIFLNAQRYNREPVGQGELFCQTYSTVDTEELVLPKKEVYKESLKI